MPFRTAEIIQNNFVIRLYCLNLVYATIGMFYRRNSVYSIYLFESIPDLNRVT